MTARPLTHRDYSVGWVCALNKELVAATIMLDKEHPDLPIPTSDQNTYTLGSIGNHNIAIACLPQGDIGTNPAATVATRMTSTFPLIRFWLMVGIAGGVPPKVRLGDIVVSTPLYDHPGVLQWDLGIAQPEKCFRRIGVLNKAPDVLRTAVTKLEAQHAIHGSEVGITSILENVQAKRPRLSAKYLRSDHLQDVLFRADYEHVSQKPQKGDGEESIDDNEEDGDEDDAIDCRYCDRTRVVKRRPRETKIKIHYGLVASGNAVIKNAREREEINQQRLEGLALCFEMEAAGIANNHPCIVIRGICDYSDSHKNYAWQEFAATVAAAYARELLGVVAPSHINLMPPAAEILMNELKDVNHKMDLALQTTRNTDMNFALSRLPSVNEAAFNSYSNQSEPLCHPETRIDLLREIKDWVQNAQDKCIFWLQGMAGTGKSTISRTIARDYNDCHQLGASFFFKRGEGDRNNASRFFTTIATQLGQRLPDLRPHLKNAVETDPVISTKTMKEQFERLILKPMSEIKELLHTQLLLVIDALDECEDEGHVKIVLHLLARIQAMKSLNMRIFITSRPELPIRLDFDKISGTHQDFILHEIPKPVITHDISVFLRSEFAAIKDNYKDSPPSAMGIPLDWPYEQNLQALIIMAVPLFIFAATMCRFIGETGWDWDPVEKLSKVLRYQHGHLSQLEMTYLPVLDQIMKGDITESDKQNRAQEFRDLVGSIVILFEPLSKTSLAVLLDLNKSDVERRLHVLHSVLRVPDDPKIPVRLFHLSFRDFLIAPERKQSQFWIDECKTHKKIAFRCLDLLSKPGCLKENICSLKPGSLRTDISDQFLEQCLPAEMQYACRFWVHHLEQAKCGISDESSIRQFLDQQFLFWIEALSLMGRIYESINMIAKLKSLLESKNSSKFEIFLDDAKRFILYNYETLNFTPLQLYSSAILFAPATSIIRNRFKRYLSKWLLRLPKTQDSWNAAVQTIEGHSSSVEIVSFSRDGKLLASASTDDGTIRVWDVASGAPHLIIEDEGNLLMFSPDDKQLLSTSCKNHTIRLWDIISGALQKSFDYPITSASSIRFLPDILQLALRTTENSIQIWDIVSRNLQMTLEGHPPVGKTKFSPDGTQLASTSQCEKNKLQPDYTLKLWDLATGSLKHDLQVVRSTLWSIEFSPNSRLLASSSRIPMEPFKSKIELWSTTTGDLQWMIEGHSNIIGSLTFSPDGKQLVSGSSDTTVKVWDTGSGALHQTLKSHSHCVYSVVFSPDGHLLASASNDGTIKLWEVSSGIQTPAQNIEHLSVSAIHLMVLSPDGKWLISAPKERKLKLWDTCSETQQHDLGTHDWIVFRPAIFLPNSRQFLTYLKHPKEIKLWEVSSGTWQHTLTMRVHVNEIGSVVFSRSVELLALCADCFPARIELWKIATGTLQHTFESCNLTLSLAFSHGDEILAATDGRYIMLWDVVSGAPDHTLMKPDYVGSIAFSPDGKLSAFVCQNYIRIFSSDEECLTQTLTGNFLSNAEIAFSPDSQLLALCGSHILQIWDTTSWAVQQTVEGRLVSELGFHQSQSSLTTKWAMIRTKRSEIRASSLPSQPKKTMLWIEKDWITLDGEKLLRVPREYHMKKFEAGLLILTHVSGQVNVLEFDWDELDKI